MILIYLSCGMKEFCELILWLFVAWSYFLWVRGLGWFYGLRRDATFRGVLVKSNCGKTLNQLKKHLRPRYISLPPSQAPFVLLPLWERKLGFAIY